MLSIGERSVPQKKDVLGYVLDRYLWIGVFFNMIFIKISRIICHNIVDDVSTVPLWRYYVRKESVAMCGPNTWLFYWVVNKVFWSKVPCKFLPSFLLFQVIFPNIKMYNSLCLCWGYFIELTEIQGQIFEWL